jgi:biotin carboxylase
VTDGRALVVLGGGPAQRRTIDVARAAGLRTIVCDSEPGVGDLTVSTEDVAGVRRAARGADGLIAPGTDWPVRVAAMAAEDLGLPHPVTPETAVVCTNKLLQRERLQAAGVPQPEWSASGPPAYPCVVKPVDRQGQRGLGIVRDPARLDAASERARLASRSGRILFERFVPGPEVTIDGFSVDGRFHAVAVTDRLHFADAPGVARSHVLPAAGGAAEAGAAAAAAAAAVGIREGPSYVQLILAADGPVVIEVAARLGGGHDPELIDACLGVDLAGAAVRAALGERVDATAMAAQAHRAGAVEFLRAPAGRLVRATAPADVVLYHRPGHVYAPLRCGPDRAGYVLALGSTPAEALAAARSTAAEALFVTE